MSAEPGVPSSACQTGSKSSKVDRRWSQEVTSGVSLIVHTGRETRW